jgi:tetrahydromethanopterin S-methyltransferase subunit E
LLYIPLFLEGLYADIFSSLLLVFVGVGYSLLIPALWTCCAYLLKHKGLGVGFGTQVMLSAWTTLLGQIIVVSLYLVQYWLALAFCIVCGIISIAFAISIHVVVKRQSKEGQRPLLLMNGSDLREYFQREIFDDHAVDHLVLCEEVDSDR